MGQKFSFQEVREKAIIAAEKEIEQGMEQIAEQGGGEAQVASTEPKPAEQAQLQPVREIAGAAGQQQSLYAEPTQNINIPIPLSLHTRLGIIKAQKRQNIKDMVVQAIDLWLDVQEGKKAIKSPEL